MDAPAKSLFDQTALLDRAERLVEAARKAGADAADAVALRSMSLSIEVRDGAVEESERAEGDDLGLRVLVGKRQAVVSTNDMTGDNIATLAGRAVAMARAAPEDKYAGLADESLLAHDFPDLDLIDRELPTVAKLEELARAAEAAGLAVKGVAKSGGASASAGIGGMVLVTSHGFRGAYLGSRHGVSMMAIAGSGTGMERDYDYSSALHASDLESPEKIGRVAGERTVARLNPRKVSTRKVPVVFDPRIAGSLVSHLASAANGASVARKTSFLRDKMGQKLFADGIAIIDDPLAQARPALASLRRRRRRRQEAGAGRGRRACARGCSIARPRANWASPPPVMPSAACRRCPRPARATFISKPGRVSPEDLIADIKDGFYVTDLIGSGANMVTGDYSRGASGFWIENGQRTYPVSEVTIAGNLLDIFRNMTPANDLEFRYGTNAPTVRLEGLTVAGQ